MIQEAFKRFANAIKRFWRDPYVLFCKQSGSAEVDFHIWKFNI